jgi:hypothetical protein
MYSVGSVTNHVQISSWSSNTEIRMTYNGAVYNKVERHKSHGCGLIKIQRYTVEPHVPPCRLREAGSCLLCSH